MRPLVLMARSRQLDPDVEADWLRRLPAPRRDALLRWPDSADRQRSLLGTRLLAEALRRHGFPDDALLTLRHPPGAAPTLDVPLHWSVSHCDGRVACAVSADGPVGVDVEAVGSSVGGDFHLYLDDDERRWAGSDSRRLHVIWTAKEAVAKAAGTRGLRDLPRVAVAPDAGSACFDGTAWRLHALPVGPRHVGMLALRAADAAPRVVRRQPDNRARCRSNPPSPPAPSSSAPARAAACCR